MLFHRRPSAAVHIPPTEPTYQKKQAFKAFQQCKQEINDTKGRSLKRTRNQSKCHKHISLLQTYIQLFTKLRDKGIGGMHTNNHIQDSDPRKDKR